jgi:hypothetical protein
LYGFELREYQLGNTLGLDCIFLQKCTESFQNQVDDIRNGRERVRFDVAVPVLSLKLFDSRCGVTVETYSKLVLD